jgi:hypothetical protein
MKTLKEIALSTLVGISIGLAGYVGLCLSIPA